MVEFPPVERIVISPAVENGNRQGREPLTVGKVLHPFVPGAR